MELTMKKAESKKAAAELAKLKPGEHKTADHPNVRFSHVRLHLALNHQLYVELHRSNETFKLEKIA
jgi:hypothetical protein